MDRADREKNICWVEDIASQQGNARGDAGKSVEQAQGIASRNKERINGTNFFIDEIWWQTQVTIDHFNYYLGWLCWLMRVLASKLAS